MNTENPTATAVDAVTVTATATATATEAKRALIIVDVQNDFCPGGALGTARGDEAAAAIAGYLGRTRIYDAVVATQDWHIDPGTHFSEDPDFVRTWPVHCRADTTGAQLHSALAGARIDEYFHKGQYGDGYSGFDGTTPQNGVRLGEWLQEREIGAVDVCGIATDFCVRATAFSALEQGFQTRVLAGLCAPVSEEGGARALEELAAAGAEVLR